MNADQEESGDPGKGKIFKHRGKEEAEEIGKRQNLPRMNTDERGLAGAVLPLPDAAGLTE